MHKVLFLALMLLPLSLRAQDASVRAPETAAPQASAQPATPPTESTPAVTETSLPSNTLSNSPAEASASSGATTPAQAGSSTSDASTEPTSDAPGAAEPTAPALTASEEEARLVDLLSLVKDNTLGIHKRENPAYFQLLKKALDRSIDQLNGEVAANPRFNELYSHPDKFRGQLVRLNINARKIISIPVKVRNVANLTEVYEIWGWTEEAKAHMYCCVVPELPPGFPKDGEINKRIDLVGYFLKMQAYQPGNADPNQRNLVAPLIMGRITDSGPIVKPANDPMGNWPIILIIGFGTVVMLRLMMHLRGMTRTTPTHRNYRRRSLAPIDPDALADGLGDTDRGLKIRNADE